MDAWIKTKVELSLGAVLRELEYLQLKFNDAESVLKTVADNDKIFELEQNRFNVLRSFEMQKQMYVEEFEKITGKKSIDFDISSKLDDIFYCKNLEYKNTPSHKERLFETIKGFQAGRINNFLMGINYNQKMYVVADLNNGIEVEDILDKTGKSLHGTKNYASYESCFFVTENEMEELFNIACDEKYPKNWGKIDESRYHEMLN
jgi:hypothetical protein